MPCPLNLNLEAVNERHRLTFDTDEVGELSLDDDLDWVVLYEQRSFSRKELHGFLFSQSCELPKDDIAIVGLGGIGRNPPLGLAERSRESRVASCHEESSTYRRSRTVSLGSWFVGLAATGILGRAAMMLRLANSNENSGLAN